MGHRALPRDGGRARPRSLWGPVLVYAPEEEQEELVAELERLAVAHGLSRNRAELSEVFSRLRSESCSVFIPPSRLAEPSYFPAEGDPIVSARAVWRLADPDAAFVALDTPPPKLLWVGESEDGTGECFQLTADRKELSPDLAAASAERALLRELLHGVPGKGSGPGHFVLSCPAASFASTRSPNSD